MSDKRNQAEHGPSITPEVPGDVLDALGDLIAEVISGQFGVELPPQAAEDICALPWEERIPRLFPQFANKPFSPSHRRFWDQEQQVTPTSSPDPTALVLPRGQGKSTTAEMAAADLLATGRRKFVLYFSATQERANEHVMNVAALLESPPFQALLPGIGKPLKGLHGNQKAWRHAELRLANGAALRAVGLDAVIRGIKVESFRPDAIFGDDFDEVTDSPEMVRKKINVLTKSIIPARAADCWICLFQNMIHSGSIMTRVARRTAKFLVNTLVIGPVKALENFTWEMDPERPNRAIIVTGEPTWPEGMGLTTCQAMLDEMGLEAFLTECQQDVDLVQAGSIYPVWDEVYHISTVSEFVAQVPDAYLDADGILHVPPRWEGALGHDWGATLKHPAAATWWYTPDASAAKYGVAGIRHKVRELVLPWTRDEVADMTPVNYGEAMLDSMWRDEGQGESELDQIKFFTMSHEASSERHTYANHLSTPLTFNPSRAGRSGGIAQMRSLLAIDPNRAHPYRRYPAGYKELRTLEDGTEVEVDLSGEPVMGCPNVIWIVADGHGELELDADGGLVVRAGKGNAGMERGRWEMPRYHWDTTVDGREHQYPFALDEDVCCADRYVAWTSFPKETPLTLQERVAHELERRGVSLPIPEDQTQLSLAKRIQQEQIRMIEYNRAYHDVAGQDRKRTTSVRRRRPSVGRRVHS